MAWNEMAWSEEYISQLQRRNRIDKCKDEFAESASYGDLLQAIQECCGTCIQDMIAEGWDEATARVAVNEMVLGQTYTEKDLDEEYNTDR